MYVCTLGLIELSYLTTPQAESDLSNLWLNRLNAGKLEQADIVGIPAL